ncbi:MAG TPA: ATP-binding protein [Anaerolineae bacterium]
MTKLSLVQRFRLASLVVLILGLIGIGAWVQGQIEAAIIHSTATTTAVYVESFVEPQLVDLAQGRSITAEQLQTLAKLLRDTPLQRQIVAFKVWGPKGLVLYDTDASAIGKTFTQEPRLTMAWQGQTTSRISDLESDENVTERPLARQLLETYSPVHAANSDKIIAVAEFYQTVTGLQADIAKAQRMSWLVVGAAMLVIFLLLSGFVQRAGDTIHRQQDELTAQVTQLKDLLAQNEELNERVRRGAARSAALNERFLRRISAELHDGAAQYLSLALLRIDPGGGEAGDRSLIAEQAPCEGVLAPLRDAVKHALQEIRSVSGGLGLPELDRVTLPEAIGRAVRGHERRTGTKVAVSFDDVPSQAPLVVKITTYRVIQEALNNAFLHAGGVGQEVRARALDGELYVEVRDQGPGFDAAAAFDGEQHLGLLGMRERVQSLGGAFAIDSAAGRGTAVRACLRLGMPERVTDAR